MKTLIVVCVAIVAVFSIAFASSDSLSTSEMDATWGGGNCKVCPGTTNSTCTQNPCSGNANGCNSYSGGSFKVCEQGTHPEQNCLNDDEVSCGTRDYCAVGEGGCEGSEAYDCSCHSETVTYVGCA